MASGDGTRRVAASRGQVLPDHSTAMTPSRMTSPPLGFSSCREFRPIYEIFMFCSDLRRNTRGALTLACSKKAINQTLDDNNTRLDPEVSFSRFHEPGFRF
jgi:hypothetical protein